ncbi:MAG: hypothetical protein PVG06_17395 [Desulfobacterales bacterium]|jgi:hypothetical protein
MQHFWIIGGGKFGLKAAKKLCKANPSDQITIVEQEKAVCGRIRKLGYQPVCEDGLQYLDRQLISTHDPDWIIPAIPLHVAYEWIRIKLSARSIIERIPVTHELVAALPNPIDAETGHLYCSIANFKCPESCPEPDQICTYTQKPRPMILHEFLKSIQLKDLKPVVIRSHQLLPGVGGYKPQALYEALKEIETAQKPVLLSTACSCHAVIHTLKHSAKR